jgi:hypothetical protein
LLHCAKSIHQHSASNRTLFFADADYDRLLNVPSASNVVLTDGRDLESYFFLAQCLDHLCNSFHPGQSSAQQFYSLIEAIARPIGILRIASQRAKLELPFKGTLQNRLSKYIVANADGTHDLDVDRLIQALLQNSNRSLSELAEVKGKFVEECLAQNGVSNFQIVHGKDLARLIAWRFHIAESFAGQVLILALSGGLSSIRASNNVSHVSQWLV